MRAGNNRGRFVTNFPDYKRELPRSAALVSLALCCRTRMRAWRLGDTSRRPGPKIYRSRTLDFVMEKLDKVSSLSSSCSVAVSPIGSTEAALRHGSRPRIETNRSPPVLTR